MDEPVLSVCDLSVTYRSGLRAVDSVSFDVNLGGVIGIMGRNGAGKTSLLRGIAGFLPSEGVRLDGEALVEGRNIAGSSPIASGRAGVVYVPERAKVFPGLTVKEHLALAQPHTTEYESAFEIFPALRGLASRRAGLLSGGERQMVAIASAWMRRPKILMIDEMSLGLAPIVVKEMVGSLAKLRDTGTVAIVLVDLDASAITKLADDVLILSHGVTADHGPIDRVRMEAAIFQ